MLLMQNPIDELRLLKRDYREKIASEGECHERKGAAPVMVTPDPERLVWSRRCSTRHRPVSGDHNKPATIPRGVGVNVQGQMPLVLRGRVER